MNIFDQYARYYDLLYQDKDYAAEAAYVLDLLSDSGVSSGTLLELGSGTGRHALQFAQRGFLVEGADISPEMVAAAERTSLEKQGKNLRFLVGDARTLRTGRTYDAVVSLFHVASYQTANEDLLAMFRTAAAHLEPGGVFLFDCWFGPGVLADPPTVRIKRLEDEYCRIFRVGEPVMHPRRNVVDVNFTMFVQDKRNGTQKTIEEKHSMRYLFGPEVSMLLDQAGLAATRCLHWLTDRAADAGTWQAVFVAHRK